MGVLQQICCVSLNICVYRRMCFLRGLGFASSSSSSAHASHHPRCCCAQVQLAAAAGSAVLGLAAAGVGLAGLAGPAELLSPTSALTLCVVCAAAGTAAPAVIYSLAWNCNPAAACSSQRPHQALSRFSS